MCEVFQDIDSILEARLLEGKPFMKYPCHLHLVVAHHIIRYLKGTSTQGQFFPTRQFVILIDYSDVRLCWLSRYTEIDHWLMHVSWF